MLTYIIIALFLGLYWHKHSIWSGYTGHNYNIMRGRTILVGMAIWPLALLIKLFSGNLLR